MSRFTNFAPRFEFFSAFAEGTECIKGQRASQPQLLRQPKLVVAVVPMHVFALTDNIDATSNRVFALHTGW